MIGIIPAGGIGSRWGGYYKELLPISDGKWLVDNTVELFKNAGVEKILVISSPDKIYTHVKHFNRSKFNGLKFNYVIQYEPKGLWDAIKLALPYCEEFNLFAMPDTIFNTHAMDGYNNLFLEGTDLVFGTFKTNMPYRFGVLLGNEVRDKDLNLTVGPHLNYEAWGCLGWDFHVTNYMSVLAKNPLVSEFSTVLTACMTKFKYNTWNVGKYTDFASWEDYSNYIKGLE